MAKRYLKIFNSKAERDAALQAGELDVNSVCIWGKDAGENSDGKIEFGAGNGVHQINLGVNDISNSYDDNDTAEDDSSSND